ncbi:MAG TPA: hypothetical protein VHO25_07425 [Polyangiaceae bacterium]|nr:hypothetical protein [Polyangiaceae bacterium]
MLAAPAPPVALEPAVAPATPPGDVGLSVLEVPHAKEIAHRAVATDDVAALFVLILKLQGKLKPTA